MTQSLFLKSANFYACRDGVAVDRIIGFQELGGVDDFTTKALENRLLKAGTNCLFVLIKGGVLHKSWESD